jgi:DNA helicase HerA-like ATPase
MRPNPGLDIEAAITELGVGEALVSFLDEKGTPGVVQRALVCPPHSQIGPITPQQRQQIIANSNVAGVYDKVVDRESAYERLKGRAEQAPAAASESSSASWGGWLSNLGLPSGGGGRRGDSMVEAMMKSAARSVGSSVGRQIVRGVLGSLLGGRR